MSHGRSGRSGRAGPPAIVQRALGWNGTPEISQRTQLASCVICGHELRFETGSYGQLLEICTSGACPGRVPHRPQPDPAQNTRGKWGRK